MHADPPAQGVNFARRNTLDHGRSILAEPWEHLLADLRRQEVLLAEGLRNGRFVDRADSLFQIRIALAEIASEAVQLELQASGGKAYLSKPGAGFQRRLREVAFVPIVTPSLVQLKFALHAHAQVQRVSEVA